MLFYLPRRALWMSLSVQNIARFEMFLGLPPGNFLRWTLSSSSRKFSSFWYHWLSSWVGQHCNNQKPWFLQRLWWLCAKPDVIMGLCLLAHWTEKASSAWDLWSPYRSSSFCYVGTFLKLENLVSWYSGMSFSRAIKTHEIVWRCCRYIRRNFIIFARYSK